ncbi:MAG: hypothetical protein ACLTNK_00575 [Akkermansia muciniphila]
MEEAAAGKRIDAAGVPLFCAAMNFTDYFSVLAVVIHAAVSDGGVVTSGIFPKPWRWLSVKDAASEGSHGRVEQGG